ncbi:hypothetical protein [Streptomyces sp. NPDC046182]|uniref:hypothetical protein n=1 Tax=Streptomyces sp. NPDC046182 TaxID=3154601 RepID=UPI0033CC76FA
MAKWTFLQAGLSAFAGRRLELDITVYESEAAAHPRNSVRGQRAARHLSRVLGLNLFASTPMERFTARPDA